MAAALRGLEFENTRKVAEHEIIDALCDISVFTINAGGDIPESAKWAEIRVETSEGLDALMLDILMREISDNCRRFNKITICGVLEVCASLCYYHGYDFKTAMLETIKELNSRTGSYDESAKKWVKDTSEQAKAKWYKADYEKARIEK